MGLMWVINTLRLDTSKSEYVLQPYTILTAYSLSTSPTHHPCRHIVHSWKAAWIHTVPAHPVTWNTPWYSTCSRSAFELYLCCASYFNFNFNPTAVWRCLTLRWGGDPAIPGVWTSLPSTQNVLYADRIANFLSCGPSKSVLYVDSISLNVRILL